MDDLPSVLPARREVKRRRGALGPELQEKLSCVSFGCISLERLRLNPKIPLAQNRLFLATLVARIFIDRLPGIHDSLAGQSFCLQTFPIIVKCLLSARVFGHARLM